MLLMLMRKTMPLLCFGIITALTRTLIMADGFYFWFTMCQTLFRKYRKNSQVLCVFFSLVPTPTQWGRYHCCLHHTGEALRQGKLKYLPWGQVGEVRFESRLSGSKSCPFSRYVIGLWDCIFLYFWLPSVFSTSMLSPWGQVLCLSYLSLDPLCLDKLGPQKSWTNEESCLPFQHYLPWFSQTKPTSQVNDILSILGTFAFCLSDSAHTLPGLVCPPFSFPHVCTNYTSFSSLTSDHNTLQVHGSI